MVAAVVLDATTEAAAPDGIAPEAGEPDGPSVDVQPGDGGSTDAASEAAAAVDAGPCDLDPAGEPTELRCTGLYSDWALRTVASTVEVYDPGLHLWSDGAVKTRWVYLPPGTTIDTSNMDEWTFPIGTKFWKQFVVGGVLTETRLLHKVSAVSWYATTLPVVGRWVDGDRADDGHGQRQRRRLRDPEPEQVCAVPSGARRLRARLRGGESVVARGERLAHGHVDVARPAHGSAVRGDHDPGHGRGGHGSGYLHANCGITCHNATNGLAHSTGLFMRLNVGALSSVGATDTYLTGWNQPTLGFHVVPERIAQCSPASSCVYYRMSHREGVGDAGPGTQMPPIDTHQVDPGGEAILTAWIDEGCDAGADGGP